MTAGFRYKLGNLRGPFLAWLVVLLPNANIRDRRGNRCDELHIASPARAKACKARRGMKRKLVRDS